LLSSIALCVGLGFVVVSVILPDYLLSVISYVLNKSIWALNETVLFTERLPYSIFKWLYVSPAEMVTLNLLTVSLLALLATRRVKYVWLNIVLLLGLLGYNAVEKNQERQQHTLAIHAVPKHTAVSIIDGTHALLLSDAEFLQDRRNVSFRLNNFWAAKGITDTTKIHYFGSGKGPVQALQWRGKSFVFLSQSLRQLEILPSKQPVDYLIVANKAVRHLDEVLGKIPFRRLVIDGSYSAFYTQQLLQEAQALGVEVYPIYTKGALVLSD
jgi:competence protein ComEC